MPVRLVAGGWPRVLTDALRLDASQAFVKFLGAADNRVELSFETVEEIRRAGCHWAVCYPTNRRPKAVKDSAVIFIGRLTRDPNDIRVFGRAIGMAYRPGRDDATPHDIAQRSWKGQWSRYIRVHATEFVHGTMNNGVSLNELMDALKERSFASTLRNAAAGTGNVNPRFAYRQQAHVELSAQGLGWLSERLEGAFTAHGKVSPDTLGTLDWPNL